jgi:fructose-1,6-bisphosphatase I
LHNIIGNPEFSEIYEALGNAGCVVYRALQAEHGLHSSGHENATGDDQLELDVIADEAFVKELRKCSSVRYAISEERPKLIPLNDGKYSVALDPLDGSKSAIVGIPSGAIFCIFGDAEDAADFNGSNVKASGFFVFGLNLEVFFADSTGVFRGVYDPLDQSWTIREVPSQLPSSKFFAVNASNKYYWEDWLQKHYDQLINVGPGEKPDNLRWYASMVSEIKRLVIQGGVFAYPGDTRDGYQEGHLRLVYEAIPMAFLIGQLGGSSTDGLTSILSKKVVELHQKTPVFLGEATKIRALEQAKIDSETF